MGKETPKVFAAKINKKLENNNRYSITRANEEKIVDRIDKKIKYEKSIDQKIREIFNSVNYIYKADVEITLKDKVITKKIIGKNRKQIVTIDNEVIDIDDIIDIKLK